ncbi:MAG: fructose PTS transporter subunit IIA, partial [Eubacteriales bacterium]|nr:fructose PTS transporter subunit IIA [Eubacteriales bacterium]
MLKEENIFLNVNATKKEEVLEFIANKAFKLNICKDEQGLLQDLKKREEEFSTGLQDGFAIPHAKSKYVTAPTILFLKTEKGIDWGTMDDKKVNYLFALLVPSENENNIHLQMISKLTTCLLEDDFKEVDGKKLYRIRALKDFSNI